MQVKISTFIVFLLFLLLPAVAQAPRQAPLPSASDNPPLTDAEEARTRMESDMAKKAAKERVAALKTDTDKLLKLSIELKTYVDKSDENVLSVDVIRRAEAIEKLARSVKDKMKGPN
ncbi:MAG TPA: hypothetical protein VKQ11_11925 [Candidatus Sulfotelmatobacter sp.]|nr:hypothetical protein [Candidatus Sulfotelmatobacter sp.]